MAHPVEMMEVDDLEGFDNKENSFHQSNMLTKTPCTEKGYEELDVSELNMKLRYSMTPVASPMSKSYTVSTVDNKILDNDLQKINLTNENVNLTKSLDSTITKTDKTTKSLPLQSLPTKPLTDCSLRNLDNKKDDLNIIVTVNGVDDLDENLSYPSTSSSVNNTPEATTPTKDIHLRDAGSPIMRGLKSVLNIFRSSQSPINLAEGDNVTELSSSSVNADVNNSQEVSASTPLHKSKTASRRNSPQKDSLVFSDDLERELQWKDESTILFSHEKIPIHKLFFQNAKPQASTEENLADTVTKEEDISVEYMDISYNESMKNKTFANSNDNTLSSIVVTLESDSEFVDCETTLNEAKLLSDTVLVENNPLKSNCSKSTDDNKIKCEEAVPVKLSEKSLENDGLELTFPFEDFPKQKSDITDAVKNIVKTYINEIKHNESPKPHDLKDNSMAVGEDKCEEHKIFETKDVNNASKITNGLLEETAVLNDITIVKSDNKSPEETNLVGTNNGIKTIDIVDMAENDVSDHRNINDQTEIVNISSDNVVLSNEFDSKPPTMPEAEAIIEDEIVTKSNKENTEDTLTLTTDAEQLEDISDPLSKSKAISEEHITFISNKENTESPLALTSESDRLDNVSYKVIESKSISEEHLSLISNNENTESPLELTTLAGLENVPYPVIKAISEEHITLISNNDDIEGPLTLSPEAVQIEKISDPVSESKETMEEHITFISNIENIEGPLTFTTDIDQLEKLSDPASESKITVEENVTLIPNNENAEVTFALAADTDHLKEVSNPFNKSIATVDENITLMANNENTDGFLTLDNDNNQLEKVSDPEIESKTMKDSTLISNDENTQGTFTLSTDFNLEKSSDRVSKSNMPLGVVNERVSEKVWQEVTVEKTNIIPALNETVEFDSTLKDGQHKGMIAPSINEIPSYVKTELAINTNTANNICKTDSSISSFETGQIEDDAKEKTESNTDSSIVCCVNEEKVTVLADQLELGQPLHSIEITNNQYTDETEQFNELSSTNPKTDMPAKQMEITKSVEIVTELNHVLENEMCFINSTSPQLETNPKKNIVDKELVISANSSPFVSLSTEKKAPDEQIRVDDETIKLATVPLETISRPISPKIVSKGYNINFDEIDDPFATKAKIRLSPPPESSSNNELECKSPNKTFLGHEEKKNNYDKNRRKSQLAHTSKNNSKKNIDCSPAKEIPKTQIASNNTSISKQNKEAKLNESDLKDNNIILGNEEQKVNDISRIIEINNQEVMQTPFNVKDETQVNKLTMSESISEIKSNSSSSGQSVYFSIGTSSNETIELKSKSNLSEVVDKDMMAFTSKSNVDLLQSALADNVPDDEDGMKQSDDLLKQNELISMSPNESKTKYDSKDDVMNISNITSSSKMSDERDITVREIHTEDEDTIEGPFLETDDFTKIEECDFSSEKDIGIASLSNVQGNIENADADEIFIDAETFEFLMNQNQTNEVADSGKESLFLKFDPLFARRLTSDGVVAALNQIKKRQNTPNKTSQKPQICLPSEPGPSQQNNTFDGNIFDQSNENLDDFNSTVTKPMMIVTPAVNSVATPRNKATTPPSTNRRSFNFTSPAMAVIDRLLSLSACNSPVQNTTTNQVSQEQNEADLALGELRELLSEKEEQVQNLRSETVDLKDRLSNLESQMQKLETESEERLKQINELNARLVEKTKINKSMALVVEEYERTIASLISEKELDKKRNAEEKIALIKERDEQTAHLASMEVSFSDLHSKYEKSKQVILGYKANEETYTKSIKDFEENVAKMQNNYELLKQHATSKLNHANQELEKMNRSHESEVLKYNAMIKRKEMHITSLEETLAQKTKANEELTAICDELINKVG